MKLLTFTVPCYNSQDYMRRCVDSLLIGGEDVEIIIVDDGSSDDTGAIADAYAEKYPSIVRAIHQENGGHGAGLNAGLNHATGLYFKVVDSDDWVDEASYRQILDALHNLCSAGCMLDMMISNFVYEKEGAKHKSATRYHNILPQGQLFGWEETRNFKIGKYILMHSVIYRTQLLRDCHLVLPKHTFYVDNLFVYVPLPYVKTMYYLDVDFYRYYIGREDQSVNEKNMIKNIDQQIKVNKIMVDAYPNRIINIHPSLIPSFCGTGYYGLKVHEGVLKRGVKVTGATVHFVDEGTDTGPIILQKAVEVKEGDTPEILQRRVMEEAEWVIMPKAIDLIANDKIEVVDGLVRSR